MRLVITFIAAIVICDRGYHGPAPAPPPEPARVDFKTSIQPILAKKCSPCHFAGGVMHARLPFDKPETIVKLGTKLFSRIKDEESRATIREFLSQNKRPDGE
jgi:hypothetical protein